MSITTLLRRPQVQAATGKARSTLYADIQRGLLTPPVELGRRARGWPNHEIEAINQARISGATDDEIRGLVRRLVAQRKQFTTSSDAA